MVEKKQRPCPVCDAEALAAASGNTNAVAIAFALGLHVGAALTVEFVQESMCGKHRAQHLLCSIGIVAAIEAVR